MDHFEEQFDSLLPRKELNPKLWNDSKLDKKVKSRLVVIGVNFAKDANIDLSKLQDMVITGSSANYNWSKYSDIDLHLVVDYTDFSEDSELISEYFRAKKTIWNDDHDITIYGHEVETYIQDEKEPHYALGVYSLKHNKWLHNPEHISASSLDRNGSIRKAKVLAHLINSIQDLYDAENYKDAYKASKRMKEKIRKMRKQGLEKGGEFSTENLAFKLLRRSNYLEQLDNLYHNSYDNLLGLK